MVNTQAMARPSVVEAPLLHSYIGDTPLSDGHGCGGVPLANAAVVANAAEGNYRPVPPYLPPYPPTCPLPRRIRSAAGSVSSAQARYIAPEGCRPSSATKVGSVAAPSEIGVIST